MSNLRATVTDYRVECVSRGLRPRTIVWYTQKLDMVCDRLAAKGVTDTEQVTHKQLQAVIADLVQEAQAGGRSTYTVKGYAQVIKGWAHYLEDEGLVPDGTMRRIKLPRVAQRLIKTLSDAQLELLFDAAKHGPSGWLRLRDRAILRVLVETGVRSSELVGLRAGQVDLANDPHIRVIGKGNKEREVGPLSPEAVRDLRRYLRAVGPLPPEGAFFLSRAHEPLTIWGLNQLLYRLRDRAELEGVEVRPHVFRHTFARKSLEADMDIYRLARLMGHTSVTTTEGYLRDFQQREARKPVTDKHVERQQGPKRR